MITSLSFDIRRQPDDVIAQVSPCQQGGRVKGEPGTGMMVELPHAANRS